MPLTDEIAKLKSIQRESKLLSTKLQTLAVADKKAPAIMLSKLSKLVANLDLAARQAARERRDQEIKDLSADIEVYDVLLALNLSPASRATIEATRSTLVAKRGYHRGRMGTDFVGIVSKAEVDHLAALISEVNRAVKAKKKAVAYIDGAIRIGMLAAKLVAKITG